MCNKEVMEQGGGGGGGGEDFKTHDFWGYRTLLHSESTYTICTVPGSDLAFVDLLTSPKSGSSKIALLAIMGFTVTCSIARSL